MVSAASPLLLSGACVEAFSQKETGREVINPPTLPKPISPWDKHGGRI